MMRLMDITYHKTDVPYIDAYVVDGKILKTNRVVEDVKYFMLRFRGDKGMSVACYRHDGLLITDFSVSGHNSSGVPERLDEALMTAAMKTPGQRYEISPETGDEREQVAS